MAGPRTVARCWLVEYALASWSSVETRRPPNTAARTTGIARTATTFRRTDHSETRKAENAPGPASRRFFLNAAPKSFESNPHPRAESEMVGLSRPAQPR